MRPEECIGWTGMEHFKHKNVTRTNTVPLSWNQMFSIRGFFAATNGSPNSTAVALSLQMCVAAVTGTPRTQERFSLQANEIKQEI